MRDYGIVSPKFWTGETGRQLRAMGYAEQLLAAYFMTCPSSNMIGLFYIPIPTISHETGIPLKGASKALRRVQETGFCHYNFDTECVWVPEMAKHQIGDRMKETDNRHKAVIREWDSMRKSGFYQNFYERYCEAFNLPAPTISEAIYQAPSKPLRSQDQDQDQDQKQDQDKTPLYPPDPPGGGNAVSKTIKIPPVLQTSEFKTTWLQWVAHRKEIKKPLTPTQAEKQIAKMARWGPERSIAAMTFTIEKGWQGLKEPDDDEFTRRTGTPRHGGHNGGSPNLLQREQAREQQQLGTIADWAAEREAADSLQASGLRQGDGTSDGHEAHRGINQDSA